MIPPIAPFFRILTAAPRNIGERLGTPIDMVVLHVTQGTLAGAANEFRSSAEKKSAHFGVSRKGDIYRFVPVERCAYHCGNIAYNRRSIGIEMEGRVEDPKLATASLLLGVETLIRWLCALNAIPMDREHLIGHNEVPDPNDPRKFGGASHHVDPGPYFPWSELMSGLAKSNAA